MSDLPLISIVIPVYNGSDYLARAIDSALAQSYPNVEILVVNDGSIDNGATREIALSYGDSIRYFEKENGGVATALNFGIREMKGEYFSWLSHDDEYYPEKLSILQQAKSQLPQNTILYSDYEFINNRSKHKSFQILDSNYLNSKPLYAILRNAIHGCTLLVPKSAFNDCGLFEDNLQTAQDYDLWFKMRIKYKFIHIPHVLIKSRIHENQGSRKNNLFVTEGTLLWIKFATQISFNEIIQCEKSINLFYAKLGMFLMKTPYKDAASFCFEKVKYKNFYKIVQRFYWGIEIIKKKYRTMKRIK